VRDAVWGGPGRTWEVGTPWWGGGAVEAGSCAEDEAGWRPLGAGRGAMATSAVRRAPRGTRSGNHMPQRHGGPFADRTMRPCAAWTQQQQVLPDRGTRPAAHASVAGGTLGGGTGGEFDPGSGSTLAACLMHASRTGCPSGRSRGGRVRNTWPICPPAGGSPRKRGVIPYVLAFRVGRVSKGPSGPPVEEAAAD
jgi:hypothetical protein